MICFKEIVGENVDFVLENLSLEVRSNLFHLHHKINIVRRFYGKPLFVTSGLRTEKDHERIYREINNKRLAGGQDPLKVPWGSFHLKGAAIDIADANKELQKWITQGGGLKVCEDVGLWMEKLDRTPTWVHFQIYPPASGQRFFWP